MKKALIALLALPLLWAAQARGQSYTTYGPTDPQTTDNGHFSDYSADGTVVLPGGSVTLSNNSTYEHGNLSLQNDGTWNSQTGSLDLFNAAGAVTISGTTAPRFFNLQVLNAGSVSVNNTGGTNIGNQLLFGTSTITSTVRATHTSSAIRFADDATYTGGTTDAQHVDGYVTKAGNEAFIFPVGNATDLRTLAVSAPAVAATISAAWFAGDPGSVTDPSDGATHSTASLGAGLISLSPAGFWDYIFTAGDDDGLTITVSIPDVTSFATAANLRLAGWNGTQWISLSAGATASGTAENSTLSGTIPAGQAISAIAIGSAAIPLPVTYVSFKATANGCSAMLDWKAFNDATFRYFSIERSSDGKTFTEIGRITEAAITNDYSFVDKSPAKGINYYRLRDVDAAWQHGYSVTRAVSFDCNIRGTIRPYPTVTTGTVHIELPEGYEAAAVCVTAINGQRIYATVAANGLSRMLQLGQVAAGSYMVHISNNNTTEIFKVFYQP